MRVLRLIIVILFLGVNAGCDYFEQPDDREAVVRVNDSYLYKDDIEAIITENTSAEDSALIVSNFITRWATQQLLIDRAKLNLSMVQQEEFDDLVENYKNELYTNAYTNAMVMQNLDTALARSEIEKYYNQNIENFKLSDDLLKLRYIYLDSNNSDLNKIRQQLRRFDEEDKKELDKIALQFRNYTFNDSVWVKAKSVYEKIELLNVSDRNKLLNKSNFLELEDSLGVYLIFVKDVLKRNDQAPLEYASPKIRQILLNKRKLMLAKELEKDITKDAIKNEQFEIYK